MKIVKAILKSITQFSYTHPFVEKQAKKVKKSAKEVKNMLEKMEK